MANKIIELTLKVNGAQTLDDMANSARELEAELRRAGSGAEGFSKGMASLAGARSELKEFKMDVKGITFDQQIAGATRFVNGFISSFALMKTASMAFGDEASKSIESVVQTLGGLMTAMTALQNIASAFDGETMKSLKLLGGQWGKLVGVVRNASVAMKAALISTGIGAILVGLGLIIANWEKIIKFGKEMLGISVNESKEAQKRIAYQEEMLKIEKERAGIIEEIAKLTGSDIESMRLKLKYGQLVLQNLKDELIVQSDLVDKAEQNVDKVGFWLKLLQLMDAENNSATLLDEKRNKNAKDNLALEAQRKNIMSNIVLEMEKQAIMQQEMIAYALETKGITETTIANIKKGGDEAIQAGQKQKLLDETAIKNADLEVQRLGIYKETENKIYLQKKSQLQINIENRKNLIEQAQLSVNAAEAESYRSDIGYDFWEAELNRLATLKAELPFMEKQLRNLRDQEIERQRMVELDKFKAEQEHKINVIIAGQKLSQAELNQELVKQNKLLGDAYNATDKVYQFTELQKAQVENISQGYADYISQYDELNNAADIYSGKLQTLIDDSISLLPSGIRITAEAWGNLTAIIQQANDLAGEQVLSVDKISTSLAGYEIFNKKILEEEYSKAKLGDKDIERAAQQLALEDLLTNMIVTKLGAQQKSLDIELEVLAKQKEQIEEQKRLSDDAIGDKQAQIALEQAYVGELQKRGVRGKELADETRKSEERLLALQTELVDLKTDQVNKDIEIQGIEQKQAQTNGKIIETEKDINTELGKQEAKHKKILGTLAQEMKANDKIADWWKENGEKAQGVVDILAAGMELIGVGFQNTITTLNAAYQQYMIDSQAGIDSLKSELDILQGGFTDSKDQLAELEALRADADSSRLAEIDNQIAKIQQQSQVESEAIKAKNNQIITATNEQKKAEVDYKNKIAQAEYKNAQYQKANNIINAVMQGTLAVLKAAPNPIMMAIAGVLGVAGVATIAAQKIPPAVVYPAPVMQPLIKEKGGLLQGARHSQGGIPIVAEGGEWIAPRWMVTNSKTAPVIQQLESIRTKKYADGGQVTQSAPQVVEAQRQSVIDYDMLAGAMGKLNIWTSIAEIRDTERTYTKVVYNASSI